MNEAQEPNRTVDVSSGPADSLDAGLAAGFGRPAVAPRSSLGDMRPPLLKEAAGESAHVVQPKSDAMPPPEQAGDRYQLQGEIARGGMGAVLRGRDVDLGRDLAVKVLLGKYADRPEVARRFIEEAQVGAQLQHPGVVPVYDVGRFGDRPFFTMKLVKGQTLAALLSERAGPAQDRPRFLAIALQVAQTLAYAHAKGVIHRDLKPANVMVGSFGEVQVMDWGLAKVLAEGGVADEQRASQRHQEAADVTTIRTARSGGAAGSYGSETEAGSLLGTPAYMPPEQANGDVALLDRRADVFGLGAILCEILTGKPPHVGRSAEEVRRKAANGDLADATARLDTCGADAELIALTRTCLAAEAIDRPKDAQAVAEGLTAYLNGVQERLHQAELAGAEARARAVEEAKRRRLTLALAGTVLLALTLGGGGYLYVKTERDARQAQVAREVHEALNQATALREQAKAAPVGGAALFAQAREQVQRALALVESGPADDTLKAQVTRLQAELDEEDKDRKLIAAFDEARLAQAENAAGKSRFASERAVPKFREAFGAYGLLAGEVEPAAAAERIRQRPAAVREAIVAVLDEWDDLAGIASSGVTKPEREWLRAVLAAAEPGDAWGQQFRAARAEKDGARRRAALEKLAASADVAKVPARALTRLAKRLGPAARVALLRRAQAQYPADFWVNHDLGVALQEVTPPERDEAVRFLTAAVSLRPDSPGAHNNLGAALRDKGQVDEAIACFKKAIELDPKLAEARTGLAEAERLAAVQEKLPAFLKGDFKPTTNDERLGLAEWCRIKKLHHTATGLYAAAFAADAKLADDLSAGHRYSAACYAALAAAGQGDDAAKLDDQERTRLRQQARDWLRADLALRTEQLESGQPAGRTAAQQALRHWQQDRDLAGLRDKDALTKLPAEERVACETLWADVAALLKKAEEKAKQDQQLAEAGQLAQRGLGLLQQKKWAEAEALFRQSLAIREKLQPDAWTTFNTRSLLGGALLGQKKYADAEPLLLAGYEGMKQRQQSIPPQGKIRLPEAALRLVQLYDALGKPDEVARWTREREAIEAAPKNANEGKP